MTMRYFYTDPLAAQWMDEKFQMRFVDPSEPVWWHVDPIPPKIFVHPDSLHLLEMRHGDIILDQNGNPDVQAGEMSSAGCKIIQRKGIAFMWPESEAANG